MISYDDLLERERQLLRAADALEQCAASIQQACASRPPWAPRVVATFTASVNLDTSKLSEALDRGVRR